MTQGGFLTRSSLRSAGDRPWLRLRRNRSSPSPFALLIRCAAVTVKAVGIQVALMAGISLAVTLAFSFFRPREKKVYAPKVKYREENEDAAPPPTVRTNSNRDLVGVNRKGSRVGAESEGRKWASR